uniref:Cytochrome c6 n=1 Tax=Schizymenia dubyi TaxID=38368 RepID=A0A1C9C9G1_9FLOR|nr:cytochrome c553 [Schizymenia dubyi]AOM64999.1 cytochrome c553 [Schizymenia dubyi]
MRLIFTLLTIYSLLFINSINATVATEADINAGEQIFSANCSACHNGGNNVIMPEKTLQKDVLEKNEMNTVDAIMNQVKNGKNAMPAFGGRLTDDDINNVANYVIDKSRNGW